MSPEQQLADLEYQNEMKRKFREAYKKDYLDELKYKHDTDEFEKLLKHEADLNELKRRGEWTEQMRYVLEKLPGLHLFSRQEVEFLEAEQRTDDLRKQVGLCMEAARGKSAPQRLEIDLTEKEFRARSIEVRPARHHRKLRGVEDIIFRLRSPLDGSLSVFNLGTTGDTLLIYPNYWQRMGKIMARTFVDLPGEPEPGKEKYEFGRMRGTPFGVEVVRAFVTPAHVSSYIPAEIPHESFCRWTGQRATTILCDLAARLAKLPAGSWAMGEMSFEVLAG